MGRCSICVNMLIIVDFVLSSYTLHVERNRCLVFFPRRSVLRSWKKVILRSQRHEAISVNVNLGFLNQSLFSLLGQPPNSDNLILEWYPPNSTALRSFNLSSVDIQCFETGISCDFMGEVSQRSFAHQRRSNPWDQLLASPSGFRHSKMVLGYLGKFGKS